MSAHTKGPWSIYRPISKNAEARLGVDGSNGHAIVFFAYGDDNTDSGIHGATPEEAEANARLIAAAPDLLEALKGLYADQVDYLTINKLGGKDNHWMKAARAAISKAEGTLPADLKVRA